MHCVFCVPTTCKCWHPKGIVLVVSLAVFICYLFLRMPFRHFYSKYGINSNEQKL